MSVDRNAVNVVINFRCSRPSKVTGFEEDPHPYCKYYDEEGSKIPNHCKHLTEQGMQCTLSEAITEQLEDWCRGYLETRKEKENAD